MAAAAPLHVLHIVSSTTSLLTCLVVLLYMLHPAMYDGSMPRPIGLHSSSSSSTRDERHQHDCLLAVSDGWWQRTDPSVEISWANLPTHIAVRNTKDAFVAYNESLAYQWAWHPHSECHIERRDRSDVRQVFSNRRLGFIGDSHMRMFHNWVATALGGVEYHVPKNLPALQHNNLQALPALNATVSINMTHLASEIQGYLEEWSAPWPDILFLDASVWHVFTSNNMSDYTRQLTSLLGFLKTKVPGTTQLVWLSPPPRNTVKAPTWGGLSAEWIRLYNRVAVDVGFTYPAGPAHHLDLYTLAIDCLPWCSRDGLHVGDTVNELALQILVNLLLQLDTHDHKRR